MRGGAQGQLCEGRTGHSPGTGSGPDSVSAAAASATWQFPPLCDLSSSLPLPDPISASGVLGTRGHRRVECGGWRVVVTLSEAGTRTSLGHRMGAGVGLGSSWVKCIYGAVRKYLPRGYSLPPALLFPHLRARRPPDSPEPALADLKPQPWRRAVCPVPSSVLGSAPVPPPCAPQAEGCGLGLGRCPPPPDGLSPRGLAPGAGPALRGATTRRLC